MRIVMMLVLALSLVPCGAVFADAISLRGKIISCFPSSPAGYVAEEVTFELSGGNAEEHLVKGLVHYLQDNREITIAYQGEQNPYIRLSGKGQEAFRFALAGHNPGCQVTEVAGRKAVIMYESLLVVMVKNKVAVLFEGDDDWPDTKKILLALAGKFDYGKLESLIN